ncbi:hypothetical protein [Empedobacter brevis]
MKRSVLGFILGLSVMGCNSKPDKEDENLKIQAMTSCENAAITPEMSGVKQKLVKDYCSCSTDKMMGEFTYVEMMQMNNPSQELQDRLMKLVEPCLKELKTKSAELGE